MRMKRLAREQGIEPQFTVLETVVLPLHHSRNGAAKENRTLVHRVETCYNSHYTTAASCNVLYTSIIFNLWSTSFIGTKAFNNTKYNIRDIIDEKTHTIYIRRTQ